MEPGRVDDLSELKPCPFCGCPVYVNYSSDGKTFHFWHRRFNGENRKCVVKEPIDLDGKYVESFRDAIAAWNRRYDNGKENQMRTVQR